LDQNSVLKWQNLKNDLNFKVKEKDIINSYYREEISLWVVK